MLPANVDVFSFFGIFFIVSNTKYWNKLGFNYVGIGEWKEYLWWRRGEEVEDLSAIVPVDPGDPAAVPLMLDNLRSMLSLL